MLKKEGVTNQKELSRMFPNSVNYLNELEQLIGISGGIWDFDVALEDRALYLAYFNSAKNHKVEIAIDSECPKCYLAVNVVGVSPKNEYQAVDDGVASKIIDSGIQLTNQNSDYKRTAFFQSYVNDQVKNCAVKIVRQIIPLL